MVKLKEPKYNDNSPIILGKDYSTAELDHLILNHQDAKAVRAALEARARDAGDIAAGAQETSDQAVASANNIGQRFDDQINGKVDPDEAIDFRHSDMLGKTFNTSRLRGDFFDRDLQQRGINVRWFGATGDGKTDDAAAIEAAIFAAEAGTVKQVYFPAGQYFTSTANRRIGGISLIGENRMTSTIISDTQDPVFIMETNGSIDSLGFHTNVSTNNMMIGITKNGSNDVAHWNISLTNLRFDSIEYPDATKKIVGNWGLKPIWFDLDNLGLWDLSIKNISMQYVYAGVTFNTINKGWLTGSVIDDIVVKGFTHHAFGIISSNSTSNQITQCKFANMTAQVLYETTGDDAAGFIVSGVGNEYDNLTLFNDGTYTGHALELRWFGGEGNDSQAPSFTPGATAANHFVGGTLEGDIYDPDNLRQFQYFDKLKLQINGKTGTKQEVIAANELHPNLLSPQGFKNNIIRDLFTTMPVDAKITTGADKYGTYIDILMGSTGGEYTYIINEPRATVDALKSGPYTIGLRFIDMSTITPASVAGYLRFNGKNGPMDYKYSYTNPSRYGEMEEWMWIFPSKSDYFSELSDFSGLNQCVFWLNPDNHIRIYGVMLSAGAVMDFGQLTDSHMNVGTGATPLLPKGADLNVIVRNLIKYSGTYFINDTNRPADTPPDIGSDDYFITITPGSGSDNGMIELIDTTSNTLYIATVRGGNAATWIKLHA